MAPAVVMRPTPPTASANHIEPSGPNVIPHGYEPAQEAGVMGNSVMTPAVLMRPIRGWTNPLVDATNQSAPSEPAAISAGLSPACSPAEYSVMTPLRLIRPILPAYSVNHMAPSGPAAMPQGAPPGVSPFLYSVMVGCANATERKAKRERSIALEHQVRDRS